MAQISQSRQSLRPMMEGVIKMMIRIKIRSKAEKWPCAGGYGRLHFEAVDRGATVSTVYWQ
jgi:hypothetical protein